MSFIYGIICHRLSNPLIFTVKELLKSSSSRLIVHVDKKATDDEFSLLVKKLGKHARLEVIDRSESIAVNWGSFSQIEVMLLLLNRARLNEFKYFSLISGDDIPLQSNECREKYLSNSYSDGLEFIGCNPVHDAYQRLSVRYSRFMYKKPQSLLPKLAKRLYVLYASLARRNDISGLPDLYKGCSWFTLSDKAIAYIFDYMATNDGYLRSFKESLCGDEIFFQTIIFNSPFKECIYGVDAGMKDCDMALRFIDWESGPEFPKMLDKTDYEAMRDSKNIFARKIAVDYDLAELERSFG